MRLRRGSNVAWPPGALDVSIERHAPRTSSPIPPTDENLIDGDDLSDRESVHVSGNKIHGFEEHCRRNQPIHSEKALRR